MTATQTPEIITKSLELISIITDQRIEQGATAAEAIAFATAYTFTKIRKERPDMFRILGAALVAAGALEA